MEATAAKIAEIATATVQQASNAEEVSKAIQGVAQVTEQAAAGSEEMASSSEELGCPGPGPARPGGPVQVLAQAPELGGRFVDKQRTYVRFWPGRGLDLTCIWIWIHRFWSQPLAGHHISSVFLA